MPITNEGQVRHMSEVCKARIPAAVESILERWGDDRASLREAGIIYASQQIADLVAHGVDGIHLYSMNHSGVTRRIWRNVRHLFRQVGANPESSSDKS